MKLDKKNCDKRDMILFGDIYNEDCYFGGVRHFSNLSSIDLHKLIELRVVDSMEYQNNSPTIAEIDKFLSSHNNFTAHGYAVSPKRDDYRVSLEGVQCGDEYTVDDLRDFINVFTCPDELEVSEEGIYCWYD